MEHVWRNTRQPPTYYEVFGSGPSTEIHSWLGTDVCIVNVTYPSGLNRYPRKRHSRRWMKKYRNKYGLKLEYVLKDDMIYRPDGRTLYMNPRTWDILQRTMAESNKNLAERLMQL